MVKLLLSQKALSANIVFFLNEQFFSIIEVIKLVLNSQKCFVLVENEALFCLQAIDRILKVILK
jgi:hypothetical protein